MYIIIYIQGDTEAQTVLKDRVTLHLQDTFEKACEHHLPT